MKGVLLPGNEEVVVAEFPDPEPEPGDVVLRVKASAICRSDLSLYHGESIVKGGGERPFISGHEPAGVVEAVGAGVRHIKAGDRVAVHLAVGCGHCKRCLKGDFNMCPDWQCLGFTRDGGNAEYLKVPERNCLPVPDAMSFEAAALSTDAFGTLFTAMRRLGLNGNATVAIFGLGPMGLAGVLAAKTFGARVLAVDPLARRAELAGELGADNVLSEPSEVQDQIRDLTDGEGVDAAIDCSGNPNAQNAALDAAAQFGRVAFVGESRETPIRPSAQLIHKQLTLFGLWYFNVADYPEIVAAIMRHRVPLEKLVTHRFALEDAPKAFPMFDRRLSDKIVFVDGA